MKTTLLQLLASTLILGSASLAHATSAVAIYPQEGNTTCNNIALNTQINEISVSKPIITNTPVLMGGTVASARYTNTGTAVGFQQATVPINFALVKSNAGAKLFVYPKGIESDEDIRVNLNGMDQTITGITLCYGMTDTLPPPPKPKTVKSCDMTPILDETGVGCPETGERTLVCNFELDKPFFGLADGSDSCCVCNSAALVECDPSQPAGGFNSCLGEATETKEGAEVPVHIELNNDPYYKSCVAGICTYIKY